jgi:hypothetical protein
LGAVRASLGEVWEKVVRADPGVDTGRSPFADEVASALHRVASPSRGFFWSGTDIPSHRGGKLTTAVNGQRGIGAVYGTSREQPFDRWFRYPAGFSRDALALAVEAADISKTGRVADPFCGAGTVAFALPEGAELVGIEAHPLIAELARLKLRAQPRSGPELRRTAERLIDEAEPADPNGEHELVQRCFTPEVLTVLAGLRNSVEQTRSPWREHLRWALLGVLRDVASVKVGWPYQRPALAREAPYSDPRARFSARVDAIAADLESRPTPPPGKVVKGDARTAASWRTATSGGKFTASVSSPPYLNNFDYADATRLELYFLRRAVSWGDMCRTARAAMLTATTQQTKRQTGARALQRLRRFPGVSAEIVELTDSLRAERTQRDRGKEYDQLLPSYFWDLARVLQHLYKHTVPGAKCSWVIGDSAPYGVFVDTPRFVSSLAAEIGFEAMAAEVVRSRGLRWRTNGTRHQVPLTEQLIVFRHPG